MIGGRLAARLALPLLALATPLCAAQPLLAQDLALMPHQAEVQAAEEQGARLYAYDQAAWHATDRLMSDLNGNRGFDSSWLRGFIVLPRDDGQLDAVFYGELDGVLRAGAIYQVDGSTVTGGELLDGDKRTALSPLAVRMVQARDAAVQEMARQDYRLCSASPANTVVFPPTDDGTITAYILTSTTNAEIYPLGGHYRFTVGSEGQVTGSRRFLNSCLTAPVAGPSGGDRAVGFVASHLLDPYPTEIHFFASRYLTIPLYLTTTSNALMWLIEQGHTREATRVDSPSQES